MERLGSTQEEPKQVAVPDAVLDAFLAELSATTETWARKHDLWEDCVHKEPLKHYNDEPQPGWPFLLLCGDGPALDSLRELDGLSDELAEQLRAKGVFIEMEDACTGAYHFNAFSAAMRRLVRSTSPESTPTG